MVSRVLLTPGGVTRVLPSPPTWVLQPWDLQGWPWSLDPTLTRPWCQPRRLGQRRWAFQPRLSIPLQLAPNTPLSRKRRGRDSGISPASSSGFGRFSPPTLVWTTCLLPTGAPAGFLWPWGQDWLWLGFFDKAAHLG